MKFERSFENIKKFFQKKKKIKTFHSFRAEVEYPGSCCVLLKQTFSAALTKLTSLEYFKGKQCVCLQKRNKILKRKKWAKTGNSCIIVTCTIPA
jgi:hypothetical protein